MILRRIALVLLAAIAAALVALGIYTHVHGVAKVSRADSSASSATLGKDCTKRVIYYANNAAKGSYRFDALQKGHSLKQAVSHDQTKLCHDPSFAAAMVDFAHTGKIRPTQVNALARHYMSDRKAWFSAIFGLLDKGNSKNGVKNPAYAVISFSVINQSDWYSTEGMTPHGKQLPTVSAYTERYSAGWVLVEHLKNGQTRELRILCGEQPVVPYKHKAVVVSHPSVSPPPVRIVTVVYHHPSPPTCKSGKVVNGKCSTQPPRHTTPPGGCTKGSPSCGTQPPPGHSKPPTGCTSGSSCGNQPPPSGCQASGTCSPPPPSGCSAGTHPSPLNGTCIVSKDPSAGPMNNPSVPDQVKGQGTTPVGGDPGPATQPVDSPTGCNGPCSAPTTQLSSGNGNPTSPQAGQGDSGPGATNVMTPPATSQPSVAPPITSAPGASGSPSSSGTPSGAGSTPIGVALH